MSDRRFRCGGSLAVALMLSVAPVAGVTMSAGRAVGASPSWSIMSSPDYPGSSSALSAVSCVSATNCFAVGSHSEAPVTKVLIEHWNGNEWLIVAAPSKPSAYNVLSGVSCASANRCIAVGYFYARDHRYKPLIEGWDGNKWSIMTAANFPGSNFTALSGVACPSANSCFAGRLLGDGPGLPDARGALERHRWSNMSSRTPPGSTLAVLNEVSCPTRTNCFAVGQVADANANRTLVEYWNGTAWKIQAGPYPPGAQTSGLIGVSCPSLKHCFAVGFRSNRAIGGPLTERWNGKRWLIVSSPKGRGMSANTLLGVTCTSASNCFAVGSHGTKTLVEHWNGNRWTAQASPNPPPSASPAPFLSRVSCVSATNCFAVGLGFGTLVERYS